MKKDKSSVIFAGFILAVICILGGFSIGALGLTGWNLHLNRSARAVTAAPLQATPVRPIVQTAVPASPTSPAAASTGIAATPSETVLPAAALQPGETTVTIGPPALLDPNCIPLNHPSTRALVVRVLDGVTIEVDEQGEVYEVRYIGAAMAESSQDPSVITRSTAKNAELVAGRQVLLIRDRSDRDPAGRRPRYVISGSIFVNLEMVRSGYAISAEDPPDLSCRDVLLEAERQAVAAAAGLWIPPPTPTRTLIPVPTPTTARSGQMTITSVAKRGSIWQEPEEYVEFRNDSLEPLQLLDWTLQDNERHVFTFPTFILGPGQYCRVYTNLYRPVSCGFSYYSPSPIWNNDQDCAYLKDPFGVTISTFCYGYP